MKIVTSEVMREIDRMTIDCGFVKGEVLMERAGVEAAKVVVNYLSGFHQNFKETLVILCGKGNNGGDGYVIAKELHEQGYSVEVWPLCSKGELKGDAFYHAKQLPEDIPVSIPKNPFSFKKGQVLIDCLLGTGLKSILEEPFLSIIKVINQSDLPVIAIDIPSGLNGSSGESCGEAVVADLTIGIGLPKAGYFTGQGPGCTGQLVCVDIGFPEDVVAKFEGSGEMIDSLTVSELFCRRPHDTHKYRCGNVVVIGGSHKYMGAVALTTSAAARSGAGMVTCIHPDRHLPINLKSIISVATDFSLPDINNIMDSLTKANTIVFGPGIVASDGSRAIFLELLNSGKRLVIDAGALSFIPDFEKEIQSCTAKIVLTPHVGELRRLSKALGISGTDAEIAGSVASRLKVCLVLKGQFTKVFNHDGSFSINSSGSSKLATAGSGDVLAGILGSFTAEFEDFYKSVCAAVYVHGLTAEYTGKGMRGTVADDLVESIPDVLQSLSPFA